MNRSATASACWTAAGLLAIAGCGKSPESAGPAASRPPSHVAQAALASAPGTRYSGPKYTWPDIPDLAGLKSQDVGAPYTVGPGIAVAEPFPSGQTDRAAIDTAAGAARWLQWELGSQGALELSPSWSGTARLFARFRPHPEPTPAEANRVFSRLGCTHMLTSEVSGTGAHPAVTLRLCKLPEGAVVGTPIPLPSDPAALAQALPGTVAELCRRVGVTPAHTATAESASDLQFLGSLPRFQPDAATRASLPRVDALAAHSPLAAATGITLATMLQDWKPVEQLSRALAKAQPESPIAWATIGWGLSTGRASIIVAEFPIGAATLRMRYPHSYLANLAGSEIASCAESWAEASDLAREAARCAPSGAEAWRLLGLAMSDQANAIRQGRYSNDVNRSEWSAIGPLYDQWQKSCRQTTQLDPTWGDAWLDLSYAAAFQGQGREAIDALARARALMPGTARVYAWGIRLFHGEWFSDPQRLNQILEEAAADHFGPSEDVREIGQCMIEHHRPDLAMKLARNDQEKALFQQVAAFKTQMTKVEQQQASLRAAQRQQTNTVPGGVAPTEEEANYNESLAASGFAQSSGTPAQTAKISRKPGAYEPQTLFHHSGPVYAMAFSPNGKLLAAGGRGSTLDLWSQDRTEPVRWNVSETSVYALAWSPDGRLLATAGTSGVVRIWDAATHAQVRTLSGHTGPVRAVSWAHAGALLASGGDDGTVRLWDTGSGAARKVLSTGSIPVGNLSFSPDGRLLATSSGQGGEGTVCVWEPASGKKIQEITTRLSLMQPLAWSPDGKELAIGQHRGAGIWDVATGKVVRSVEANRSYTLALAWSSDRHVLVSTGSRELWVVGSADETRPLSWNTDRDHTISLAAKPAGPDFASAASTGLVQLWKPPSTRK